MKKLYFAYGSNMSQSRLESRVGKVTKAGVCRINGYKLTFNAGAGYANMTMTGSSKNNVEGVIYELTAGQMRKLDKFEGFPHLYQKMVFPYKKTQLYAYICINPGYATRGVLPTEEYISYLIKGCAENGLKMTMLVIQQVLRKKLLDF